MADGHEFRASGGRKRKGLVPPGDAAADAPVAQLAVGGAVIGDEQVAGIPAGCRQRHSGRGEEIGADKHVARGGAEAEPPASAAKARDGLQSL